MTDDRLRILGYRARAPSGAWLYWCGACWLLLRGKTDFLLPDDPAASEAVFAETPGVEAAHCFACRANLATGEMRD
jgi:hypothetical protein